MRSLLGVSLLPLLAAGTPVIIDSIHKDAAPLMSSTASKHIDDAYMVVFKKHVNKHSASNHHSWVQDLHLANKDYFQNELKKRGQQPMKDAPYEGLRHTYHIPGMMGYSGHFHEDVVEEIRRHPDVAFIERDSEVSVQGYGSEPETEKNAPWGLARISHRKRLNFGNFNKYVYAEDGGEGVDAYVIDTGTNYEHVDFEGRAHWGKTIPAGDVDADGNGHGTHCSGTIAGKRFGVAKKANIYAVKVLRSSGTGTMSDVVKGVEYALDSHKANVKKAKDGKRKNFKGSVANMSLGGGKSVTLELAVNAAVDNGMHFAVAAGNDNSDACNSSPAGAEKAVTVCASTLADTRAYFSNFGTCTDIFAPGLNILSAWIGSPYATNTISGTSMASPHVCGLLAYYLSLQPDSDSGYAVEELTPGKLKNAIIAIGTRNALKDVPSDTPNVLIWNGGGSSNWTEIVDQGGYEAASLKSIGTKFIKDKKQRLEAELEHIVEEIEELFE